MWRRYWRASLLSHIFTAGLPRADACGAYIRMRWAWPDCQCVAHMLALLSCPLSFSLSHGVREWDMCVVAHCTRWMLDDMYVDATLSRRGMPSVTTDSTASWLNSLHFGDMLD